MKDTERNRRKLVRFVAQEVRNEAKRHGSRSIPHFDRAAIGMILKEAQRRRAAEGKLSLRLRELGGLIRIAGDLASEDGTPLDNNNTRHTSTGDRQAVGAANCRSFPRAAIRVRHAGQPRAPCRQDQRARRSRGGLRTLRLFWGRPPSRGHGHPIQGRSGQVIATGGLSDLAKESVTNISAVVKKLTGKDIKDYDLHVQFPGTHNVDGDSASITMATAIISAFEGVPIDQNLAMTGSLSVRGEVLPIEGSRQRSRPPSNRGSASGDSTLEPTGRPHRREVRVDGGDNRRRQPRRSPRTCARWRAGENLARREAHKGHRHLLGHLGLNPPLEPPILTLKTPRGLRPYMNEHGSRAPLTVLFKVVLIDMIGFTLVIPFLTYFIQDLAAGDGFTDVGARDRWVGIVLASYTLGQFLFTPFLGAISDAYGRRPVLILGLVSNTVFLVAFGLATSLWMALLG